MSAMRETSCNGRVAATLSACPSDKSLCFSKHRTRQQGWGWWSSHLRPSRRLVLEREAVLNTFDFNSFGAQPLIFLNFSFIPLSD